MAQPQSRTIKSRAAIAGHPLHPTVVHFPIAALLLVVLTDLGYLLTGDFFWARAGLWLTGVGALGGWVASIFGIIDLATVKDIRRLVVGWCHAIMAVMMLSLASLNWLWRYHDPSDLMPWGVALTLFTAAMVALAGILGGTLVYDHRVGVELDD